MTLFFRFLPFAFLPLFLLPLAAKAQDALPSLPAPLEGMVDRGAQVRYLGKSHGLDGWIMIFKGQEQYFYVLPDGKAFLTGVLFDAEGKPVTVEQVSALQKQEGEFLDLMAEAEIPEEGIEIPKTEISKPFEYQTPAERMFTDVKNSNWVQIGAKDAPVIYSFIDPQCPHCHEFINDLRKTYIETGQIQVRLIPVGFREDTLAQAAFLLASPNAQDVFFRHLDGDAAALPAKYDINNQGIQKNLALMQAWKFDVTPMTVYQSKSGEVKLIRGRAKDLPAILSDLKG